MPTFEVDDQFHAHPKAAEAGDEALGLWVRAGSWCCAYLTDGVVPRGQAARLGGGHQWESLVRSGLVDVLDDGSYRLHDFLHWNRPATSILRQRAKASEKKRDQRSHSRAESKLSPHVSPGDTPGESPVSQAHTHTLSTREGEAPSAPARTPTLPGVSTARKRDRKPSHAAMVAHTAWKLWRTLYESSKRGYGKYTSGGTCGDSMARLVALALDAGEGDETRALECLDHWFKAYLRDDGNKGFLAEHKHGLRYALQSLSEYGTPWSGTANPAKARAEYEAAKSAIGGGVR